MQKGLWKGILLILIAGGCFFGTKLFHKEQMIEKQEQKGNTVTLEENKIPRMVKVNGTLYYDTGNLSTVEVRCGTPDGYIHSTVLPNETPKEDGESNFGSGYGYQYWNQNTIELRLPTGWTVFSTNETEASMDASKNYVTIRDGKIDNPKLVEQFLDRVNQQYEAKIVFLVYQKGGNIQFYNLDYVGYDKKTDPYTQVPKAHEYHLYVDTMKADEKPRYHFYQFQTLDMSNGMILRDSGAYAKINFTENVEQMYVEEFVIY